MVLNFPGEGERNDHDPIWGDPSGGGSPAAISVLWIIDSMTDEGGCWVPLKRFVTPQVPMLILSKELGIPKPFGPLVGGECCLEHHVRSLLEPLGLRCRFLEDISSYHGRLGEVHCGTNVHRRPFAFRWWHVMP